ncbi:MAG: DMT family transporter [Anaerolineae bacterium]|nr:DMT family transporter [Anaerolineae bacterium]
MKQEALPDKKARTRGILLALASTIFFGMAPIFGKLAFRVHVLPFTLVMLRTVGAAAALWLFYLLFWRDAIPIDFHNLMGCVGMGLANGIGSLLYYSGLGRIDASLAQLLYTLYPIWVFVFLIAAGHHISRMSLARLALALLGVFALTYTNTRLVDWLGVMLLISSGALYAWHLVLGQWTLADVDSRSVALYTLSTMALVTAVARLVNGAPWTPISLDGWLAVAGLTLFPTILARLLMFAGLQSLGGAQTSLLGLAELLVALLVAFFWLGERLTFLQWLGGGLLIASVMLGRRESDIAVSLKELLDKGQWRDLV